MRLAPPIQALLLLLQSASALQLSLGGQSAGADVEGSNVEVVGAANSSGPFGAAMRWMLGEREYAPPSIIPPSPLPDINFVSLNTEGDIAVKSYGFPAEVVNVGQGFRWSGYGMKLINILYYVKRLPDDALVVYLDGNDVVWGGCSKKQFLATYHRIIRSSGAKVVVGAEMVCGEQSCDNSTGLPKWASRYAGSLTLTDQTRPKLTECEDQVKASCRCDMPSQPVCRNFSYTGVDDAEFNALHEKASFLATTAEARGETMKGGPLFRYLNSGFIMGRAKDVREMFEWASFHYLTIKDKRFWMHDQGAIYGYWKANPSRVALDYNGELSLQLPRLSVDLLKIEAGRIGRSGLLGNKDQCFVHNNVNEWNGGPRADYWWNFLKQVKVGRHEWEMS